ncbi:MAG: amidohydrolase family protein [Gemmatimonadota bacterium]
MRCIDVSGRFGMSLNRHCGFPSPADALRHLDHLGIDRAVVFNVEGREGGCPFVNRKTLDEIGRLPQGRERLIPAFSISPVMIYAQGALAELRGMMEAHGPALHFTRGLSGYVLAECEPIFEALRDLRPVVLLDFADGDRQDLLATAASFPEVSFVVTDTSWSRMAHVLDLMSRRANILVETSWLHTADDLEILCERFGAERVLFGAGERANYGAALATLARAPIGDAARERIAHGNAERLLRLPRPAAVGRAPSRLDSQSLWQRLLAGEPLPAPVIDAHAHLGASGGYVLKRNELETQIPAALALMERLGVQTMAVSGLNALIGEPVAGNDELERALTPHGERFRGYFTFNPNRAAALAARFDDAFGRPFFVGFKTLCDYWRVPITDPRFAAMFEYANHHRLPILHHTWGGACDSPGMFADLVRRYPEAAFILGHSGGGNDGRREAEALARENANVWLEWCGSFCSTIPWEESFTRVPPAKLIFGTDAMVHNPVWELGRLLSLDVPEELIRPMLGRTFQGILARRRTQGGPATGGTW